MEGRAKAGTEKGKKERARLEFETVEVFAQAEKERVEKERDIYKPCDSQKLYYIKAIKSCSREVNDISITWKKIT